jgi:prepilin signal peptidase PulO-like enzyme (type II secretory pathway)
MAITPLIFLVVGLLGAAIGSFISLITYRLPNDEKIGMTRSRCTMCDATLNVKDLVPLISWLTSAGKCRHCKGKISIRYPLTEIACALGAMLAVYYYGFTLQAFAIAGLWWGIVAIFITDIEHQIILDEVQIAVALFGVMYGIATYVEFEDMLLSAAVGAGIGLALKYGFIYFRNKDGLGLGDVKFLAVAGIWLADGANFVPFLFFSGILGVISGLIWRAVKRTEHFPFGPALAIALLFCVVMPESANQFWKLYGLLH